MGIAVVVGVGCAVVAALMVYALMAAKAAAARSALDAQIRAQEEAQASYTRLKEDAAADLARQKEAFDAGLQRQERQYREQIADLNGKLADAQRSLAAAQGALGDVKAAAATKETALAEQMRRIDEQEKHYQALMEQSGAKFRELAQQVLDERSEKLKSEGEKGLQTIAAGIAKDIRDFRDRLESINKDAVARNGEMDERMRNLVLQTNAVSAQANNLAAAIRGDAQVSGEWGELSLRRVLDLAGFTTPTDYTYQETFEEDATGRKSKRTDFVIRMTGSRALVIDSKNTVAAIQDVHAAGDEASRRGYLDQVLASVRRHVDEIAKANYQNVVPGAFSTVLMYVPIEEVYLLAMKSEIPVGGERVSLREYAARRNVVFVNATSVVPVVRIIEMMWEMERSEKSRQEVTRAAEELLQRANEFVADFSAVGAGLDNLRAKFDAARTRLVDAPGGQSIAKAVAKLVKLGVKPRTRGGKAYELPAPVKGLVEEQAGADA